MKSKEIPTPLLGKSKQIQKIREDIIPISKSNLPVLIYGEPGTGKSLLSNFIHQTSNRNKFPYVNISMVAIPENLLLSELLGYEEGSFTGAKKRKLGLFELANKGTIFLDEISEINSDVQRLLIRLIDNKKIKRIGSSVDIDVDVRVVSSTNKLQLDKNFSNDLLLRLATYKIFIPPLRERKEDIPTLIQYYLKVFNESFSKNIQISKDAMGILTNYSFPGNLRELQNIIERLVITKVDKKIIDDDLKTLADKNKIPKKTDDLWELKFELEKAKKEINFLQNTTIIANPIWQGRGFKKENDYCFILMPFEEKNDIQIVYKDHVKEVVEKKCGLRCERADDLYGVSGIMQSVWESISKSKLIIADLTNRNSNVFYELGIAHTLGKPVIMISQSMDFVPFDLRHLRCIIYEYKPKNIKQFESTLEKTIRTVLASERYPDIDIR